MRRTAGYIWTDYKTNAQIAKELKITPILDKLLEGKRNWIRYVNRMPRNRLPRVITHYSPTGRRNHGRPLKRILDTWDRNASTSGPTPWEIYDDDDENVRAFKGGKNIRIKCVFSLSSADFILYRICVPKSLCLILLNMFYVPLNLCFTFFYKFWGRRMFVFLLTCSMEQSPFWEANRFSASWEIPRILWKPKVYYRSH